MPSNFPTAADEAPILPSLTSDAILAIENYLLTNALCTPTPVGSGYKAVTIDPEVASATLSPASGTLSLFRFDLTVPTPISNVILLTGSTAASNLTIAQTCIFDTIGNLKASSISNTTWAASTAITSPLQTPFLAPAGSFYAGYFFYGTSTPQPPSVIGASAPALAVNATAPTFSPWLSGYARNYTLTGLTSLPTAIGAQMTIGTSVAFIGLT